MAGGRRSPPLRSAPLRALPPPPAALGRCVEPQRPLLGHGGAARSAAAERILSGAAGCGAAPLRRSAQGLGVRVHPPRGAELHGFKELGGWVLCRKRGPALEHWDAELRGCREVDPSREGLRTGAAGARGCAAVELGDWGRCLPTCRGRGSSLICSLCMSYLGVLLGLFTLVSETPIKTRLFFPPAFLGSAVNAVPAACPGRL